LAVSLKKTPKHTPIFGEYKHFLQKKPRVCGAFPFDPVFA
jgi:hypothetical protein